MKELSIEEKAKRYELALERCRELYNEAKANEYNSDMEDYETIFPELVEPEDERIIKNIISWLKNIDGQTIPINDYNAAIAWLEKQGEQREQLINKACALLVNCIEDFMLRRMEIWDEECKKQTLENIRKKLEE